MSSGYQAQGYDPAPQQSATPPAPWAQPGSQHYLAVPEQAPYPPQCPPPGWQAPAQVAPRSPALALIVSIFLPGVGSMMAGKTGKGIGILVGYLIGGLLCLVLIGFIVMPVFWIWGMVAAHRDAVAWNREHGIVS